MTSVTRRQCTRRSLLGTLTSVALLAAFGAAATTAARAQTSYTLVDLGPGAGQGPIALNNAGQIAGRVNNAGVLRAVRITPVDTNSDGKPDTWYRDANNDGRNDLLQTLPMPKNFGYVSFVSDINGAGDIAGEATKTSTAPPQSAVVWRGASGTVLALTGAKEASGANAINDGGDLAGWYRSGSGPTVPSLWTSNSAGAYSRASLALLAGTNQGLARAINNARQAAGQAHTSGSPLRATLWSPGQPPLDLSYPGDGGGIAYDVNEAGQVLVSSEEYLPADPNYALHRVVLFTPDVPNGQAGTLVKLVAPVDQARVIGKALNNAASVQIVGFWDRYSVDPATGKLRFIADSAEGFVWDADNQYRNLNQWVTNLPAGAVIGGADDINDGGLILARYKVNGVLRCCLLVPNL